MLLWCLPDQLLLAVRILIGCNEGGNRMNYHFHTRIILA